MQISEDEMILEWIKGEWDSPRFKEKITARMSALHINENIIASPDLTNSLENDNRKQILEFRGYLTKTDMFEGFPNDIVWKRQVMKMSALLNDVFYINYSYWLELSSGTRKPNIAAQNIKAGKQAFAVSNDIFYSISEKIRNNDKVAKLILVRDDAKTIVLEGHARLTAFSLAEDSLPDEIEVICGYSKDLSNWCLY